MTRLFLLLLCCSFLGAVASCSRFQRVSPLDQDIIEAAIAGNDLGARPGTLQGLCDKTSIGVFLEGGESLFAELRKNAEGMDEAFHEALEDFIKANRGEEKELILARKLPRDLILVSEAEIRRMVKEPGTMGETDNAIRARYGGIEGIYQVSRPGIDSRSRIALICMTYSYSVSTVCGKFYVLRFDGNRWRIQKGVHFGPMVFT